MLEVTHALDLQVPTLLMGDFNGSVDPNSYFLSSSGHRRTPCPLLARLLGPGGAWVDVHRALLGSVPWTFQSVDTSGKLSASRIDLVLANHAAMQLMQGGLILDTVRDGGYSPVLATLQLRSAVSLQWHRPPPSTAQFAVIQFGRIAEFSGVAAAAGVMASLVGSKGSIGCNVP